MIEQLTGELKGKNSLWGSMAREDSVRSGWHPVLGQNWWWQEHMSEKAFHTHKIESRERREERGGAMRGGQSPEPGGCRLSLTRMLPSEYGQTAESLEQDHGGTKKNVL